MGLCASLFHCRFPVCKRTLLNLLWYLKQGAGQTSQRISLCQTKYKLRLVSFIKDDHGFLDVEVGRVEPTVNPLTAIL